jgi:3-carboxy-cis,cis-muconate cycloisomerase
MTFSAFDHPLLSALVGDDEVAALFSLEADLEAMLAFEAALADTEATLGLIPEEAAKRIGEACKGLIPDMAGLRAGVARDGVVAPALIAQLRAAVGDPHGKHLHRGATSQDVIDTSLTMRLKKVCNILDSRLSALVETLNEFEKRDGALALMGRTRMQRALPILARDKLGAWRRPLERCRTRLAELRPRLLVVQFGGPVGTRGDLDGKGGALAAELARKLGLGDAPCWHVNRDSIGEFASWLSLVCGALGKIGQDLALMAQNEIGEVRLAGGGASSAMAHKSNPVGAEVLVALARFGAATAGALHQGLVAENERSGAAWTLEWLTLPPLVAATASALAHALTLCRGLRFASAEEKRST